MLPTNLNVTTLTRIQSLIEANFAGRDELYAAARSLDDDERRQICERLASFLADNAIELRQIVAASGVDPAEPLDLHELAGALFELAKRTQGDAGVLRTAAEGERNLKAEYDQAIEGVPDQEAKALLDKQRRDVAFTEQVLRSIQDS